MVRTPEETTLEENRNPKTLIEKIASHRNALTLREFAEYFSISYRTAFEMAVEQRIPAIQIGANWRLDPVEVVTWLEERKIESDARKFRQSSRKRQRQIIQPRPQPSFERQSAVIQPTSQTPIPSHTRELKHLERLPAELDIVDRRIARGESDKDRTERRRIARDEERAERQRIARAEAADKRANAQSGKYTSGRGYRFWIPD